jgi:hypothetical protein
VQQVGQAVSQMDQVTQQNAALVEESAAAAEGLKQQAHELVQAVALFKFGHAGAAGGTSDAAATNDGWSGDERRGEGRARNVTRPDFTQKAPNPAPVAPPQESASARTGTDDWERF